ncbi:hypothetical protein B0A49_09306 [Cryomyces minteri]|uniref:Beta-lactamase-related domain-containing protein n=1 Tax=Cryomyces minteri TaxID=331657 RepID=A0A4U0WIV4_9PEZI|nr:hypothetical protein B0A49_09306 [Cryomyces minteri]
MHQRWKDGSVEERDHLLRKGLIAETDEEKKRVLNSAGAGCFAKPAEYCPPLTTLLCRAEILAALLNDGTSPTTNAQILKPETVAKMFENSIPQFPDFARQGIPAAKCDQTNPLPELYPQEGQPAQGWGLSFMLTLEAGATGRGKSTAHWAGLPNLFWWCDREKGVAGIIASQVVPFGDANVMGQWAACEKAVYDGLEK